MTALRAISDDGRPDGRSEIDRRSSSVPEDTVCTGTEGSSEADATASPARWMDCSAVADTQLRRVLYIELADFLQGHPGAAADGCFKIGHQSPHAGWRVRPWPAILVLVGAQCEET